MNEIYLLPTQESISETEFRALHENISFPAVLSKEILAEYDAVAVLASPQPVVTAFQSVQRDGVVQDALGNYVQAWKVVDWQQEQIDSFKASAKASKWLAIKAERDMRKTGGVTVYVDTVPKWFHSDESSRIQQLGLVMMGQNIPANLQWKTMDGTFVTMTPALAQSIFSAVALLDTTAFAKAEWHRQQMEASDTPHLYDFSKGWPTIYGE